MSLTRQWRARAVEAEAVVGELVLVLEEADKHLSQGRGAAAQVRIRQGLAVVADRQQTQRRG